MGPRATGVASKRGHFGIMYNLSQYSISDTQYWSLTALVTSSQYLLLMDTGQTRECCLFHYSQELLKAKQVTRAWDGQRLTPLTDVWVFSTSGLLGTAFWADWYLQYPVQNVIVLVRLVTSFTHKLTTSTFLHKMSFSSLMCASARWGWSSITQGPGLWVATRRG